MTIADLLNVSGRTGRVSAHGRIKPDVVLDNGREERHPEAAYYLEWYEGRKRRRISVSQDAAAAGARRIRKEAELNTVNNGVAVASPEGRNGHRLLSAPITKFLEETKLTKNPNAHATYDTSFSYFIESCQQV